LIFVETFGVLKEIPDDESEKINRDYIEKRLKKINFTPNYFSALDDITSTAKFPASITLARVLVIVFLVLVGVFISSLMLVSRFNPIIFDCPLPQSYFYDGTDSYGVVGEQSHIKAVFSSVPGRTFLMAIMVALYFLLALVSIIDSLVSLCSEEAKTINDFLSNLPMADIQLDRNYLVYVEVNSKRFPIFNFALSLYRLAKSVDPESADETFYALLWESYKQKRDSKNSFDNVNICSRS